MGKRMKWLYPGFYLQRYELLPLVVWPFVVTGFAIFTALRTSRSYDVRWTNKSPEQWERLDLLVNPKLRKLVQFYEIPPNQEAYDLYKCMYDEEVDENGEKKECTCGETVE